MSQQSPHRILLVDDEPAVLDGLCRQHRRLHELVPARGPEAGLAALTGSGPFAVVVSDYQMPGMNGAAFLARCAELQPGAARVMLTGQADLTTAIDAVNRGQIFRFLTKPCDPDLFRTVLAAGIEQFELRRAEKLLLEQTLRGSIEVLAEVLALSNPAAFGRATRIRRLVVQVVAALGLPDAWQYETAALLSQIGCVAVPDDVFDRLSRGERLPDDERAMLDNHPELARDLLAKIPRLRQVAEMVFHQSSDNPPRANAGLEVRLGSRILATVIDFEELVSVGAAPGQALEALRRDGRKHDPRLLDALRGVDAGGAQSTVALLPISQLRPGMVLDEHVRSKPNDLLVAPRGHALTESSLARLRNYAALRQLQKLELRVRLGETGAPGVQPVAA